MSQLFAFNASETTEVAHIDGQYDASQQLWLGREEAVAAQKCESDGYSYVDLWTCSVRCRWERGICRRQSNGRYWCCKD